MAEWAVRREIGMRLVSPESGRLRSIWLYTPADPWAVRVEFTDPHQGTVPWVFSRELLARGIHAPAGLGDVQVFPFRGRVAVGLDGDEGSVLMTARSLDLLAFLHATYRVVPKGGESAFLDVDAVLARVLEEAQPC